MDPSTLPGLELDGRYRLRDLLGQGSFGAVFAAEELLQGHRLGFCCLKILLDDEEREAFVREATILARLGHPHLIGFRGAGQIQAGPLEARLYLAMELADSTLRREPPEDWRGCLQQAAGALAYLHQQGLVHRDVKPDNLLRTPSGWKLGDFGLTRPVASLAELGPLPGGTWNYLAPEAFWGPAGPPADLWSLGATFQELLDGRLPFAAQEARLPTCTQTARAHVARGLAAPFDWVIPGCLNREPRLRLTAAAILEGLLIPSPREAWLLTCREALARRDFEALLGYGRWLLGSFESSREEVLELFTRAVDFEASAEAADLAFEVGCFGSDREAWLERSRQLDPRPETLLALGRLQAERHPDDLEAQALVGGLELRRGCIPLAVESYQRVHNLLRQTGQAEEAAQVKALLDTLAERVGGN